MVSISGGLSSYMSVVIQFPIANPVTIERKASPVIPIQKSQALSQELSHSSKFIAAPSSFVLLPSGLLGSGCTCYTRYSMLRWWLYSACKMYTLLTPVLVLFICCCDQVKGHICKSCDH